MINIKKLNELAMVEYKKNEDNYFDKYAKLKPLYKDLARRIDESGDFPTDEQLKENLELRNMSRDYYQKGQVDLCYTAAKMLCCPEYIKILAKNSEELGNKNLANETLVKFLQSFGVFSAMWKGTSVDTRNITEVFASFVTSVDVVLDVVEKDSASFASFLKLNECCQKNGQSFCGLIADKVDKFGKEKTVTALSYVVKNPEYFSESVTQEDGYVSKIVDTEAANIESRYVLKHKK